MTGQNNSTDKNHEIEENQFKNFSHEERNVIKSVADFDLIGDLPSEFRTGLW
mgnify:CR=1 FL=1